MCIVKIVKHYLSKDENGIMLEKGIIKKVKKNESTRGSCFSKDDEG
jgi:hypothetical protein